VAAGAVALMSFSYGQRGWRKPEPFNTTMEGRGNVHFNGATYSFKALQVTLQKNDRVTIHALLYAENNKDVVLTGKVSDFSRRAGRLSADIDSVSYGRDMDPADAMCDIDTTNGGRFSTVTITGRNTRDHNNVSLDFVSNGHEITDFRDPYAMDRNREKDRNQPWWKGNGDRGDDQRYAAAGRYVDMDEWRRAGEHFVVRYRLELQRDGDARMIVESVEDRNMPNDHDARWDHGDILKYLQRGQDVTQTGKWRQDGDRITISFDHISYGNTSRDKDEVFHGRMRNGTIFVEDYEKSFYGHNVSLSFEPSR